MSETTGGDAKILALPGADEDRVDGDDRPPVTRDPDGTDWRFPCNHIHGVVNEEKREVRCGDCGALLDPFEFVAKWARRAEHAASRLRKLQEQEAVYRTHSMGLDALTLCGLGPKARGMAGRPWTLRVTNDRGRVNCHTCLDRLAKGTVEVPLHQEGKDGG